ncbi:MAG: VPLPA-CTERM sorting domain-containing protein [Nitrospira sp.]|nr:VPLPA-CTERM sorting domain-containing protein [Nitrospira sp.]
MNTKRTSRRVRTWITAVITASAMAWAGTAGAHVEYIDLGGGGSATDAMKRYGWIDGTDTDLGDSHQVSFFKFSLSQASLVDITMTGANELGLNPAFTLYAGLMGDLAHDDTAFDPNNPVDLVSFNKIASPVDNGVTTDAFGRVSPFRDTANIDFEGQFNALGSWSMASEPDAGGVWRVIEYLTHKNDTAGNESLLGYFLPAGDYTIVAGGAACNTAGSGCTGPFIDGTVNVSASPVPVPAALYLFGTGLAGLVGLVHRRRMADL